MSIATLVLENKKSYVVTEAQVAKCSRFIDESTGVPFYLVENEEGKLDENGDVIEYKVQAVFKDGKWYKTCTCKAGQNAVPCKHIAWARGHAILFKKEQVTMRVEKVMATSIDIDALVKSVNQKFGKQVISRGFPRKPTPVMVPAARREVATYQHKAFSILK